MKNRLDLWRTLTFHLLAWILIVVIVFAIVYFSYRTIGLVSFNIIIGPNQSLLDSIILMWNKQTLQPKFSLDNWSGVLINFTRPTLYFTRNIRWSGNFWNLCSHLLIKDYLPTKFEASAANHSHNCQLTPYSQVTPANERYHPPRDPQTGFFTPQWPMVA